MAPAPEVVRFELHGSCAVLTIDRPQARNAIDPEVTLGLEAGIDRAEGDPAVRAIVLAGTPPVFCAGADLKAVSAGRGAELSTARGGFGGVVARERMLPMIAAVDGPALAGGLELVLACDLVAASTTARFGIPEVSRGLVATGGALHRLGRRIPFNIAMECAVTGDPIDAETAHRHGLVNVLCAAGNALAAALDLASRIDANAPLAVRESRAIVHETTFAPEADGWTRSAAASDRVLATEDVQEGIRAFVEKRSPNWTGC